MNILVKSGNKYFFKLSDISSYNVEAYLVNGFELKESFLQKWYVSNVRPEILTIIRKVTFLKEFKIKDNYKHLNLPEIRTNESFVNDDGDESTEKYFYNAVYEEDLDIEHVDIEFDDEIEDRVEEPFTFVVNYKDSYNERVKTITGSPSLVHAALFPEISLASKPTSVTGNEMYQIVRTHVLNNIDSKYATITSDYDFCFTVKKKLAIEPIHRVRDDRTSRQRKPRLVNYTVESRDVQVFEMTPPSKKYNNYTIIKGIVAKDHKDLKRRIDSFLNNLMDIINEPIESCSACSGSGVKEVKEVKHE